MVTSQRAQSVQVQEEEEKEEEEEEEIYICRLVITAMRRHISLVPFYQHIVPLICCSCLLSLNARSPTMAAVVSN
jgi:hypothetical protein